MKYALTLLAVLAFSTPAMADSKSQSQYAPEGSLAASAMIYDGSSAVQSPSSVEPAAGQEHSVEKASAADSYNTSIDPEGSVAISGEVYSK